MTRLSIAFAAVAAVCLLGTQSAGADDARWTIDWSSPTHAQDAEQVLDSIERAFSGALAASPGAKDLRRSADLLVASRTQHGTLRTNETNALARVQEARDRVDRDTRLLMDRRMTTAWASLKGQQREEQLVKEDQYLRTIRTVTRNREVFHSQQRAKRERVTHALQAFALSWGELAVERSVGNGAMLPNDIWLQHMDVHARSFNEYVQGRYRECGFVTARPTRALRAARTPAGAPTPAIGRQPVRGEPSGFPTPVTDSGPRPDPARDRPQPMQPDPQRVQPDPQRVQPNPQPRQPSPQRVQPAPTARAPSGKVENIGGFRWYYDFAEAAAAARSQGKLLLALATKPNCTMCEQVKETTIPTDLGRVNGRAVGYIYDIMKCYSNPPTATPDEMGVNRALRGNLPNATLMPLVGFITPQKQWVAGFSGLPDQGEFRAVVDKAVRSR